MQGQFALDVAVQCMPFYADYFEIKYDLPKLDMIAVPHLSFGVYLIIARYHYCTLFMLSNQMFEQS